MNGAHEIHLGGSRSGVTRTTHIEQRLRIAHVLAPAPWGGLESVVGGLAAAQAGRGHQVSVFATVSSTDHPFVHRARCDGVSVHPIVLPGRAYLAERQTIRDLAARELVDIVHTHGYRADVIGGSAARALGVPWITTVHGFTGGDWKNRLYERLQLRSYRQSQAVVAVSSPLRAQLAARGVAESRLHVIRNAWTGEPVPLSRTAARAALGIRGDTRYVGWIGRMSLEKGIDVLVRALPHLLEMDARIGMVGTGAHRGHAEALARQLGVHHMIDWFGDVPAAGRVCAAFDVCVLSSRTEGTPIVLLEAMAAGVPVVATGVGGVPDVIGPGEGLIVPPENSEELARAIRSALEDHAASAARARAASARLLTDFGIDAWLDAYDQVYDTARSARPAPA